MTAIYLEEKSWLDAEQCLNADSIVLLPLGAGLKEHGPHLPLNNDRLIAEFLTREVGKHCQIVVLPIVSYSFYPAFVEYPGSVSLSKNTASALIAEICLSITNFGPQKFYVLNTGVSTRAILESARQIIHQSNPQVIFHYTDFQSALENAAAGLLTQEGGGHADECETSMMLYMAPKVVAFSLARKDYSSDKSGALTRIAALADTSDRVYSPTGVWGDPTVASEAKGELIVRRLVASIVRDLNALNSL
jgi:creatinine amidohydrolase